jgi:hypothetical protein
MHAHWANISYYLCIIKRMHIHIIYVLSNECTSCTHRPSVSRWWVDDNHPHLPRFAFVVSTVAGILHTAATLGASCSILIRVIHQSYQLLFLLQYHLFLTTYCCCCHRYQHPLYCRVLPIWSQTPVDCRFYYRNMCNGRVGCRAIDAFCIHSNNIGWRWRWETITRRARLHHCHQPQPHCICICIPVSPRKLGLCCLYRGDDEHSGRTINDEVVAAVAWASCHRPLATHSIYSRLFP